MKKELNIKLTKEELKAICKEYALNEEEDILNTDDRLYNLKKAVNELELSEYIIFCLYMHYQSERKVAAILNVSRTPVNREIKKIKAKIKSIYDNIS